MKSLGMFLSVWMACLGAFVFILFSLIISDLSGARAGGAHLASCTRFATDLLQCDDKACQPETIERYVSRCMEQYK